MKFPTHTIFLLMTITIPNLVYSDGPCRDQCGSIPIHYPIGIDDGCGALQFRSMFTCNATTQSLFFITPNGNYKVQSIDYKDQTMTVYDPDMSTCTILQPHHDVRLSDLQYAIIPPSPDTIFALLNCSVDSPILHRYRSYCFDLPGHKCQDLYSSCNSFKVFTTGGAPNNNFPGFNSSSPSASFGTPGASNNYDNNSPPVGFDASALSNNYDTDPPAGFGVPGASNTYAGSPPPGFGTPNTYANSPPGYFGGSNPNFSTGTGPSGFGTPPSVSNNFPDGGSGGQTSPPCCFTGYSTVRVMSMNILDCTHFTSFYDTDKLKGVQPMDWSYGLKFSYSLPDMGCERCSKSGGTCGYDTETEALLCLCSTANNSTRECGDGNDSDDGKYLTPLTLFQALLSVSLCIFFLPILPET